MPVNPSYYHYNPPMPPSTPPPKRKRKIIDLTSPSPTKPTSSKRRKSSSSKNNNDTTPSSSPEKRSKRYREHPPQSVMVKHERVMTQRMFLIERTGRPANGTLQEDFSVLGSTGNIYVVTVNMVPRYRPPFT